MAPIHLKTKSQAQINTTSSELDVPAIVRSVISDVRSKGDTAVRGYSDKFDKWTPQAFKLSNQDIKSIIAGVPQQTIDDIKTVQHSVRTFAAAQRESLQDFEMEIRPGVHLGQKNIPIASVGAYIPGGRYPLLASAHMTIVTAKAAGVERVIACTPPIRGEIPAATVAAAHLAGADEIHILGGTQAIAAMALGTETIGKVDFIAGPGNSFVAEAKRQLFGEIGIDLPAGPTEVLIVADENADPTTVATDLLSQAEHGPDTPAVLVTNSKKLGEETIKEVNRQLAILPTRDLAGVSWNTYGEVIVTDTLDEAYAVADTYASEHVQILTEAPRKALTAMKNYGALFLGEKTCVSYGDKCIGTNHVLPTKGAARFTGGLWVGKYLKTVTYQEVTSEKESGDLGKLCGRAARAELFEGHARSGDVRANKYLGEKFEWLS
ncbi:histidinol dehydrogenase [Exophiala aquamarina CBS 119918]|uniref:Histidinol dehydrogenase n=1 Tax=Exophiala aquamarina CBS 119918 TaxID=1182545 RepID=A0A072NWW5_9EURO|nr:histidinol dehydrogenase [Exophiala aquamarina CBS 119918]KEF52339.1 histidinol dehydrogenase [Exophiala aquamarina CBS 119918]